MRPRVVAFGVLGTLATLLAAAVVFAPGVVGSVEPVGAAADALEAVERRYLLLAASLLVGLVVGVASWRVTRSATGDPDAFDEAVSGPPEAVTTARQRLTAADLESAFDAAVDGDADALGATRERLRETASRAYARSTGCDVEAARTVVLQGEWTDDPTAAATLAGGDGPTHSLGSRLRLWLDPETERERRFDRTVRATTRLAGDGR